ncbi:hypothetical protein GIB67_035990 [Kingdonia uniflora]|uniref:Pentatricopeptide repeat-containing protein n=1 Tax=Kingdonia uniflora TaxID=39325 RepID=A0A7J7N0R8_9MAGN|nr:hypothetical protein GIB67_035990 [Kingdonia uniflora]
MPHRNTITWNSMITGYVRNREISKARQLFDQMPQRDVVSWNVMICGYVSCDIDEGRLLFDQMGERDLVSWNTMISGYARNGRMIENGDVSSAIRFFEGIPMQDWTCISAMVSGLIRNGKLNEAAKVLFNTGDASDEGKDLVHAYNTLIAGYGKSERVDEARYVFNQIPFRLRNIVSWNSMIMCYVKLGDVLSARVLFNEMKERDVVSWNTMINGYVQVSDLEEASSLFNKMPNPDDRSWNSMISGFAQKGDVGLARDFFGKMPVKSLVSWNSMIAGYEQNGNYEEAIELFSYMQAEGERHDKHTLSSMLSACAGLASLDKGMLIHQLVVKTINADIPVNNSLITMYSRCGIIGIARSIFDDMKLQRDVVSWNAMIGGYASHGYAMETLMLFGEMKKMTVRPTNITFVSVLNACAHAGLVDEGRREFEAMIHEFGIEPQVDPDKSVWGSMLGACRVHKDVDLGRVAARELMKFDPENSAPYVLLYSMLVDVGRWEEARERRMVMEWKSIRKQPGYTWIESQNRVHIFVASDTSHPFSDEMYALLESFYRICGLKTLVKSFLPYKGHVRPQIKDFLIILQKILPDGKFSDDIVTSESDKAQIRLAAAKSVFQIARKWDFHILPQIFQLTVLKTKDPSSLVRREFLDKVHKLVKERSIPIRYACTFALAASDCLQDMQADSLRYMAEFIKEYRKEAGSRETSGMQLQGTMTIFLEYVLVFLIHVLAHDLDFPSENCEDQEIFAKFWSPLVIMLKGLINAISGDSSRNTINDSLQYILSIFRAIKKAEDAVDVS